MERAHEHFFLRPSAALASTWNALCSVPATSPWFWLVRSGALDTAPAVGVVLLDGLPRLLDTLGQRWVLGHG